MTASNDRPFFSMIIPAHNEAENIGNTCRVIAGAFRDAGIDDIEILVVNDNSADNTPAVLAALSAEIPCLRYVNNPRPKGFGNAIRAGLAAYRGEAACLVMGDLSDSPADIIAYYRAIRDGAECVFGSRFIKGSKLIDYPPHKYLPNRLANWFIKILFRLHHNDITNAFKCYRREVIDGIQPLLSNHFNLTVEMPLKAIVRGYQFATLPICWTKRAKGVSNLRLKEMGSRYLFIVLYVWLEKMLSKGDYERARK